MANPVPMFQNGVLSPRPSKPEPLLAVAELNSYSIAEQPGGPAFLSQPSAAPGSAVVAHTWQAIAVPTRIDSGCQRSARLASFISLASTFLPRNSGVRPIIIPATNTATMMKISMLMKPTPTPPKTLFSHMPVKGISPPSGVMESCMEFTEPFDVTVVVTAHSADRPAQKGRSEERRGGEQV